MTRYADLIVVCAVLVLFAAGDALHAQANQPSALQDSIAAYGQVQQVQTTMRLKVAQTQGRWTTSQEADFYLDFDRAQSSLKLDNPDLLLVADGQRLQLKSDQIPGRHLDAPQPTPLTWKAMVASLPVLQDPPHVEAIMLLSDDPIADLGATGPAQVAPGAPGQPTVVSFATSAGEMRLHVDPSTKLLKHAEHEINIAAMGGASGDSLLISFDFTRKGLNQPLPAGTFAFQANGSTAAGSFNQLVGGGSGQHPLVGQKAPPIELKTMDGKAVKLADIKEKVIIIDFWASWCGPCMHGLPKLQELHEWVEKEDKPAAIIALNTGDDLAMARQAVEQLGLTMPIWVEGEDGGVSRAYGVQSIPQTVVIVDGVVTDVHVGLDPGMGPMLKSQIDTVEAAMQAAEATADTPEEDKAGAETPAPANAETTGKPAEPDRASPPPAPAH